MPKADYLVYHGNAINRARLATAMNRLYSAMECIHSQLGTDVEKIMEGNQSLAAIPFFAGELDVAFNELWKLAHELHLLHGVDVPEFNGLGGNDELP